LGAAHSTQPAGQNKFSFQRTAKMFSTGGGKSFEGPLHNSLTADVNPRTGGHLSVHREAESLESIELSVVIPLTDEIRIRD
jgi:hypothetical protein